MTGKHVENGKLVDGGPVERMAHGSSRLCKAEIAEKATAFERKIRRQQKHGEVMVDGALVTGELVAIVAVRGDFDKAKYGDMVTLRATGDGRTFEDCESSAWRGIRKAFQLRFPHCTMRVESKRLRRT